MKISENNSLMSLAEGAKISGKKCNSLAEVAGLGVPVTTTERMYISSASDRSVNNTIVLEKYN